MSPQDYRRAVKRKWCVHRHRNGLTYAQSNMKVGGKWRRVLLHRFLVGAAPGQLIDHRDGDGLNCTRENLRAATRGQNQHNSKSRPGSSMFKGVSRHKKSGKWLAQIAADRRYHYLGLFEREEDAARAYDSKAKSLHGEFARLNFPG